MSESLHEFDAASVRSSGRKWMLAMATILGTGLLVLLFAYGTPAEPVGIPEGREEVIFWHFWGGGIDREVVDDVVSRFNESQDKYHVRAISMPGNNLQAKLFLSVAGGDSPDIVNQDDPVIPDWAHRGVIQSLSEIAPQAEVDSVRAFLLPAAERLSVFDNQMFGLCNGLDIRALYYNKTMLDRFQLDPPTTIEQLDHIAETIAPPAGPTPRCYGYLPDSRRLWAWGYVFGGDFYDYANQRATVNSPGIQEALSWMASYETRYGADNISAYRTADQSLPGGTFTLLPIGDQDTEGRYAVMMDGQWRVRKIAAFQEDRRRRGLLVPEFGVCPLPTPTQAKTDIQPRSNGGWVNGNFFVFPRNAKNSSGAWEFAKFWIGYTDAQQAAKTCSAGGWIPVSQSVIDTEEFQQYTRDNPLFKTFVDLAASPNQFPIPPVVGAAMFKRTVEDAAYEAMFTKKPVDQVLDSANQRIESQLERNR